VSPTLDAVAGCTRNLSVPANFLPRIFFDPDADPNELVPVRFGADNTWSFQLRASQPLFRASAFIGVGAAGSYEALQAEALRGRAASVATRARIAYYDVLLADEAARLSENTVRRIRQSLEETQAMHRASLASDYDVLRLQADEAARLVGSTVRRCRQSLEETLGMHRAGLASDYDVLRLQVELANVELKLRRAKGAAAAARRALAIELGVEELDSVNVVGALADFDFSQPVAGSGGAVQFATLESVDVDDVQQAIEAALANRSDVRQARLNERLRRTEVRVERAEYLPTVSLFGSYSINAQNNGDPRFFGGSDEFRSYGRQVGIEVSLPLFSGFQRPARLQQKEAALEQARVGQRLLRDQVEHEVKTLLAQVEEARDRGAAQQLALQQAQRGYEIASVQYREG